MTTSDRKRTRGLVILVAAAVVVLLWLVYGGPQSPTARGPRRSPTPERPRVANPAVGDVNADGVVDRADVDALIAYIYAKGPAPLGPADVNGDGKVDAADVSVLASRFSSPVASPSTAK